VAQPDTYEDSIRVHDVAVYNWLGGLLVDYGNLGGSAKTHFPILRVYAAPNRAYATVVDLLVKLKFVEGADAEEMRQRARDDFEVLPLPLLTIDRDEPLLDPELPGTPTKRIRKLDFSGEDGMYRTHPFPAHYRTEYRVMLWAHKRYTVAYVDEWVRGQLGKQGAAENEFFLEIPHREPWGTLMHAVKFTGSADQSDLEGENPRYIRKEYTFSVRTWIMKPSVELVPPVEAAGTDTHESVVGDTKPVLDQNPLSIQSNNLFRIHIPMIKFEELWPVEGDATVASSEEFPEDSVWGVPFTFLINTEKLADKVHLIEVPTLLDVDGVVLYGISFRYKSTGGRTKLEIVQRDLLTDVEEPADYLILPESRYEWKKVHYFSLLDSGSYHAKIAGTPDPVPQKILLTQLDVRRIFPQTKIDYTDTEDLGDEIKYRWFSLARRPYLCIIRLTATTGGINSLTVEDDVVAPTYQATRDADSSVQVGLAFLLQPRLDSLALRAPKTTALSAVYIQRFDGPYNGHTV